MRTECWPSESMSGYHWTENNYRMNSETILNVNNYNDITFSKNEFPTIDVM